jgi:hypothetical protein
VIRELTLASLVAAAGSARAHENATAWFDPGQGCGSETVFPKTHLIEDLPGCTGDLGTHAPPIETSLRELKRTLGAAEEMLAADRVDEVPLLLSRAERMLAALPPSDPELPNRRIAARPLYRAAIDLLRRRVDRAPLFASLGAAHRAAVEAAASMTRNERDGGPDAALSSALTCVAAFDGIADLTEIAQLDKRRWRPLSEWLNDCREARSAAEPLAWAEIAALSAKREQWRQALRGDRRTVFDAHPGALPLFTSRHRGPRGAATSKEWRYTTPSGTEVFTFRGNHLVPKAAR